MPTTVQSVIDDTALLAVGAKFLDHLPDQETVRAWSRCKWGMFAHIEASRACNTELFPALLEALHWSEIANGVKLCRRGGARQKARTLGVYLLERFFLIEAIHAGYATQGN